MTCAKWGVWKVYCGVVYNKDPFDIFSENIAISYFYKKLNSVTKVLVASKDSKFIKFDKVVMEHIAPVSALLSDICNDIYIQL